MMHTLFKDYNCLEVITLFSMTAYFRYWEKIIRIFKIIQMRYGCMQKYVKLFITSFCAKFEWKFRKWLF